MTASQSRSRRACSKLFTARTRLNAKLAEIAKAYRQRFNQDAVILDRTPIEETVWRR